MSYIPLNMIYTPFKSALNKSVGLVKSAVSTVNYYLFLTKAEYDMLELDKSELEETIKADAIDVPGDTSSILETPSAYANGLPGTGSEPHSTDSGLPSVSNEISDPYTVDNYYKSANIVIVIRSDGEQIILHPNRFNDRGVSYVKQELNENGMYPNNNLIKDIAQMVREGGRRRNNKRVPC